MNITPQIELDIYSLCIDAMSRSLNCYVNPLEIIDDIIIKKPPKEINGDLAVSCFSLAKRFEKKPEEMAQLIANSIKKLPLQISSVSVDGGYLNFFLNPRVIFWQLMYKDNKKKI